MSEASDVSLDDFVNDVVEYNGEEDASKVEEFLHSCLKFLNQKFNADQMMSLQFIQTIVKIHDGKYRMDNQQWLDKLGPNIKILRKNVNMFLSIYDPMILEKLLDQFEQQKKSPPKDVTGDSTMVEKVPFELILKINMYANFLEQSIGEILSDAITSYDQLVATNINFKDYTDQLVKYFRMVDAYSRFYRVCDDNSNLFLANIHPKGMLEGKTHVEKMRDSGLELLKVSKTTWAAMHRMCVDNLINMMRDKTDKLCE